MYLIDGPIRLLGCAIVSTSTAAQLSLSLLEDFLELLIVLVNEGRPMLESKLWIDLLTCQR